MDRRVAVIDLGSNTFHLLIVEIGQNGDSFSEVFRKRSFVYLAKDGIQRINAERFEAGLKCMIDFKEICDRHDVSAVAAVATSAIRSSANGKEFIKAVGQKTSINIEIISGIEEARLIALGISYHLDLNESCYLIMDIGGGSVEFILMKNKEMIFSVSENLGISELRTKMTYSDPMTNNELVNNMVLIRNVLGKSLETIQQCQPKCIIGASGPFEIIEKINAKMPNPNGNRFDAANVLKWARSIVLKSRDERFGISGMPEERADLSLESMILIYCVLLNIQSIKSFIVSPFALKEGIIADRYFKLA